MKKHSLSLVIAICCWVATFSQKPPVDPNKVLAEAQRKIDSIMRDPKLKQLMSKGGQPGAPAQTPSLPANMAAMASNPMALLSMAQKPDTAFLSNLQMPPRNDKGLASIPAQPMSRTQLVTFLANMKRKILGAMSGMGEKPAAMSGYDAESIDKASVLAWVSGNKDIALQLALVAANKDPDNYGALNNLGGILTMCGFPYEAVPILDYIRQDDPNNSTINNNLGQAYILMGDAQKATVFLLQAIGQSPDHPHANFALACLAYTQGNKSRAAVYCENSIRGGFISNAWVMLKTIKPDARIMELIKHRYKQQDYFSPNKYPLLPQCEHVSEVKKLTLQYREYANMLQTMKESNNRMTRTEADYISKNMANDVMAKVHSHKNPFRPFGVFAQTVIGDLGEDLSDRMKKLNRADEDYAHNMQLLRQEHDSLIKIVVKGFDKRADEAGEGNPDMALESDECKAANAVHNAFLPKFAELTRTWQQLWIQQTKDYFNDYAYWCYLASMDDHSYRRMFYSLKEQWLSQLLKLNRTTFLSCYLSVTYSKAELDSLEVGEAKCPLKANIKVGLQEEGKAEADNFADFDINCEEYKVTLDLPDGAKLSVKQAASGSTTIALGAGLSKSNKKSSIGKYLPVSIGGTVGTYITFGGGQPADWGMKYDASIDLPDWLGGKNSAGWSFGINSMVEFHGDGKIITYLSDWATQNIFGLDPPDKQVNKNIKMFNVNSKTH